jgi:hypothetical protein
MHRMVIARVFAVPCSSPSQPEHGRPGGFSMSLTTPRLLELRSRDRRDPLRTAPGACTILLPPSAVVTFNRATLVRFAPRLAVIADFEELEHLLSSAPALSGPTTARDHLHARSSSVTRGPISRFSVELFDSDGLPLRCEWRMELLLE